MIGGIIIVLSAFLVSAWTFAVLLVTTLVIVGIPFAYSYSLYKKGV